MAQTIVLSKNKLQYKEDSTNFVKFDFNQTEIKANASVLAATNDLTVGGNSNITGNLGVTGKSILSDKLTVSAGGIEVIDGGMQVHGTGSTFHNSLAVAEGLTVINGVNIINGGLEVPIGHSANIQGTLNVGTVANPQNSTLKGDLNVSGMARLGGLEVTPGQSTLDILVANSLSSLNGGLNVIGNSVVQKLNASDEVNFNGGVFNVLGTSNLKGALNVQMAQPTNLSGNLTVQGKSSLGLLDVSGASNLSMLNAGASNLSSLSVTGPSNLNSGLTVTGPTNMGTLSVQNADTSLGGALTVTGVSSLAGGATVTGALSAGASILNSLSVGVTEVTSTLTVDGSTTLSVLNAGASNLDSLTVTGASSLSVLNAGSSSLSSLAVTNNSSLSGTLYVVGDSTLHSKLTVNDLSTLNGLQVNGNSNLGTLNVYGASELNTLKVDGPTNLGNLNADLTTLSNRLTISSGGMDVSGASTLRHKLTLLAGMDVTGATVMDGTLNVNAPLTAINGITVSGVSNFSGGINLNGSTNTLYVEGGAIVGHNLSVGGLAAVDSLQVSNASSLGPLTVRNNLTVANSAVTTLTGNLQVNGASSLGPLTVRPGQETTLFGPLSVSGDSNFNKATLSQAVFGYAGMLDLTNQGTANIHNLNANNFAVALNSTLSGNLAVSGKSTLSDKLTVSAGGMDVTGYSVLSDKLTVSAGGMDVTGMSTIRNELTITDKLTITAGGMQATGTSTFDTLIASSSDVSGNVNAGTLSVTGASDLKGALTVGLATAKVASKFNGDVEINGNFHVTGAGTKTILNTEELTVKDPTITIGKDNAADTIKMALEMAYKTGDNDYKAGLRRAPGGGFMLFKDCVNDADAVLYDTLRVDTLECFSDINLKKNIVTIDGALDKLDGIRGVYHDWINTKQSEDRQIGVIAQELQAVYPELVHETESGHLTVNYPKLTAVLLQSIKELKAMVLAICAKQAL